MNHTSETGHIAVMKAITGAFGLIDGSPISQAPIAVIAAIGELNRGFSVNSNIALLLSRRLITARLRQQMVKGNGPWSKLVNLLLKKPVLR